MMMIIITMIMHLQAGQLEVVAFSKMPRVDADASLANLWSSER